MAEASGSRRVVIVGGGFAGLFAVRALHRAPVQITVIDRAEHHLFQPLLYQCSTRSMTVICTGARCNARTANNPAKPPPMTTTLREPDASAMAHPDLPLTRTMFRT